MVFNVVAWDLLWFLLNPHFGWTRFRKGRSGGTTGPGSAASRSTTGTASSCRSVLAALPGLLGGDYGVLTRHLALLAGLGVFTGLMAKAAPAYMRWYQHMRRPGADERHLCLPGETDQTTSAASGSNVVR